MALTAFVETAAWELRAACRGEQRVLFEAPQPLESVAARRDREARAKVVCGSCAVRIDCLEYALRVREPLGIWGGLDEFERRVRNT